MATIYDVAKLAQVSTATVSAVINGTAYVSPELTDRVQRAVKDLNYTINAVARGLQTKRTDTIGMLVPNIAEPVYSLMVRGVEDGLKQAGYSLILASTHNDPEEQSRHLNLLRSRRVDGLLLLLAFGGEEELKQAVEAGSPIVFIARQPSTFQADQIVVDNIAAAEMAIRHLAAERHRRIGIITGPSDLQVNKDRLQGWENGLRSSGLPIEPELVATGDYTAASGDSAMEHLLENEEPPTAVFVAGFLMMTGCLAALKRRGLRVPDDIELMTWSDSPLLDVFDPPISAVTQPSYRMGMEAAKLVLSRLEGDKSGPRKIVLPTELRIRRR